MTTTAPPEAPPAGITREDLMAGLTAAALFYRANPDAPLPGYPVISIRVPGDDLEQKLIELSMIAVRLGTEMVPLPDGTWIAERCFGPVTLEAHVAPVNRTHEDYLARAARAKAARSDPLARRPSTETDRIIADAETEKVA